MHIRGSLALGTAALLLAALTTGCSSSSAGTAFPSGQVAPSLSVQHLLTLIPRNAGSTGNLVTLNLYQNAAKAMHIATPAAGADEATVTGYYSDLDTKAGVLGSDLSQQLAQDAPGSVKQVGFDSHAVTADVSAGDPPNNYLVALGHYDTTAIDKAVHADKTWSGQLTTPTYDKNTMLAPMALAPYQLAGLGMNGTTMVVVLVNSDAATAKTNASKLASMVKNGSSVATNQPWSTWLKVRAIRTDGNLAIGTFSTTNMTLWSRVLLNRDSLLMHR